MTRAAARGTRRQQRRVHEPEPWRSSRRALVPTRGGACLGGNLLLAHAHVLRLLVEGLEAAVSELGRGVDELEGNFLDGVALGLLEERLAKGDDTLLGSNDVTLEHDVVLTDPC